ncbi:MAG: ATP-binding protein [Cyanobacteriota bacterium ELA615]|jgi:two-component system sensor histidine kinase NblS
MAAATLVVSLLMSGLTFWAVNTIQQDARLNDTRFGTDLGLLLAANVAPIVAEGNLNEVAQFSTRFYNTTSSIKYILYADQQGKIFFGIPYSRAEVKDSLTIDRNLELPKSDDITLTRVRQHNSPGGDVVDVFVPLMHEGKKLGTLAIGINPNPTVTVSSNLTRDVTIAVFISIWAMVILGAVFNAIIITRPIKELLFGVKNIASGNFKQRVELPFGGELGELIYSFNDMAQRLESYDEQNIEELTSQKAKLDTLVSTIADGAILLDTQLKLILVNSTARRLFGWESKDMLIGEDAIEHLPVELKQQLSVPLQEMIKGKILNSQEEQESAAEEFSISLSGARPTTVRVLLRKVLDQQKDDIRGIAMTVQDITREVELNEAKSHFISNVSHELRTPLFNIKSFIETLYEYNDDLTDTERKEFLETANHETDRLTRLVNDVLDLSRLESSKTYHLNSVDLSQVVEQITRSHQLSARDKQLDLRYSIEPGLPSAWGHYDLILQILTNLVGNAVKFTPSGGSVVIFCYCVEDELEPKVRIEVSDTGIGIGSEDQEAIFDRFYRVENRVHTLEGTGLGLSIVKNIIDKHHSKINLVSEVGIGTTFWFDLAVYQEVKAALPQKTITI